MDAGDYQRISARTRRMDMPQADRILNAVLGVAGEAGEIVELHKKARFHGHDLGTAQVANELGDLCFYVAWLAAEHGLDLGEIMAANIDKLKVRYPNGFARADSVARVDTREKGADRDQEI